MPDILLTTLNARYHHAAFGLRYLMANMGELQPRTKMLEFGNSQQTMDILDALLEHDPQIIGIGVYIWNIDAAERLVAAIKQIRPDILVVLGGPEVSYETDGQPIVAMADYVITGEADLLFPILCEKLLNNERPAEKILFAETPKFDQLKLPYHLYTDEDIAHRVIYVEASRGCPYTCEFCLSALDIPVRQAVLDEFLEAMQSLFDRGVRQFKFVDRTFNLNLRVSSAILNFFWERYEPGLFLHFEMVPDRLPESLRELIVQFPSGVLQFEVGIQTFNDDVSTNISRRQNYQLLEDNIRFLREKTGVHLHTDLIVGLPGETIESFATGFDRLVKMQPQEIQIGMLKRLRGTPIIRHADEWKMRYLPSAPYEILQNRSISFTEMSHMRRFAKYWDLIANSGNFMESLPLIWGDDSPFHGFSALTDWLFRREKQCHGIPLLRLAEYLFHFLISERNVPEQIVAESVFNDYQRNGRRDCPHFLRQFAFTTKPVVKAATVSAPKRQARHVISGVDQQQ